ncbi:hypothetical protein [Citreimonas sp.]|uniref:hypothetical protein n=1 Tax=Citreimonas sp. TaxID=3036715 RepID=UPI0035C824F4
MQIALNGSPSRPQPRKPGNTPPPVAAARPMAAASGSLTGLPSNPAPQPQARTAEASLAYRAARDMVQPPTRRG